MIYMTFSRATKSCHFIKDFVRHKKRRDKKNRIKRVMVYMTIIHLCHHNTISRAHKVISSKNVIRPNKFQLCETRVVQLNRNIISTK